MNRTYKLMFFAGAFLLVSCSDPSYTWRIVFDDLPDVSFRGIAAVSDSVCWVSGSRGTILKTTDGGENWKQIFIPGADSLDFRDIEAFGPDTAVVMSIGSGQDSRLYRTVDGGVNWNLAHQNRYKEGFYDAIAFWNSHFGILQGDPIDGRLFILITEDGGQTWQEIPREQMPEVAEGEYAFAASGSHLTAEEGKAWIGTGGVDARILLSGDFGKTWKTVSTPMIKGEPSTGIFSLAFRDESLAVAVGGDYTKEEEGMENVIYTDDGGDSWNLITETGLDFRSSIGYAKGMFITVGPSGSDVSTDNGSSWNSIRGPGFHTLDIGRGGAEAVWAAGAKGRVGKLELH